MNEGNEAVTTGVALYYPYIHVRNERWLKMALLYWESIRRIVPRNFQPEHDADYGSTAAVEAGLIKSTPPDEFVAAAADRFRATVLPQLEQEAQRQGFPIAEKLHAAGSAPEPRLSYEMHPAKLEPSLVARLKELEVAADGAGGPDLVMREDVGIAYMLCLAQVMSQGLHAEPATHDPTIAQLSTAFSFQPDEKAGIPALITLDLPFPKLEALADIPWPRLLQFRKDYEQQRLEFRNTINEIADKVPQDADREAIKDTLETEGRRLRNAIKEHKKAMKNLVASTAASSLQLGIPASLAQGLKTTELPGSSITILTGTAVAIITIGWWAKYQSERAKLLSSPYQYLLSVERLQPPLWKRVIRRL